MSRPSILITSVGSRAAEGILACLAPVRDRIRVIVTNSVAEAPGLYDADVAYLVPPTAQTGAFTQRIAEIITREAPDLVLNGRDEEVVALAGVAATESAARRVFLVPPPELAPIFNDKYLTAQFSLLHGLPFVATACSEPEVRQLIANSGYPIVAKPRNGGHASRNVFVLTASEQVDAALRHGGFVFQAFVGEGRLGDAFLSWNMSMGIPWMWNPPNSYHMLDLVVGRDGDAVSVSVAKAERAGSVVKRLQWLDDPALRAVANRHAEVLGAAGHRGPVNIQGVVLPSGAFVAFEWNARFVGSAPGYALMGQNHVLAALRHFVPALADLPEHRSSRTMVFRPLVFRGVSYDAMEALRQHGRLQADAGDSGGA